MDRDAILEYLGENWTGMLNCISGSLSTDVRLLSDVNGMVLAHGGKMLRPMIVLLVAEACGGINERSIRYAAASEMLHNATLIHDDVADESVLRRGNPSVASLVGPSSAVLVGDFWLARSVEILTELSPDNRIVHAVSKTLTDLAEGEMLQLEKSGACDTTEEDYLRIIHNKTASLFESFSIAAALSVGASAEAEEAVRNYSSSFGMAFQIKDDILDYIGDDRLGKPVGADINERKITLPLLGALRNAPSESARIRSRLSGIGEHPEYKKEITSFVMEKGGVEYASEVLERYVAESVKALSGLPEGKARDYLEEISRYNSLRTV